jgi:hypothetical protein
VSDDWRIRAQVEEAKVTGYLLATGHPYGRSKALFFERFGFTSANPSALRDALLAHAGEADLVATEETTFGRKYVVEGPLRSRDRRDPLIRSIWFEEDELGPVKLVTAYPAGERR